MTATTLHAVLVAALVVMAGCAGGAGPSGEAVNSNAASVPTGTPGTAPGSAGSVGSADSGGAAGESTDATSTAARGAGSINGASGVAAAGETGTVDFYLSDRPVAIDRFDSLTVTVTEVAFHRAEADGDGEDEATGTESETETVTSPMTATTSTATETTPTPTATGTATEGAENGTATATEPETTTRNGTDGSSEGDDGPASWITYDGDGREADLTNLRGPNATLVGTYDLPTGKYTMVRITVESPSGTLTENNETVAVKVPSNRLRINRPFTVEPNSSVSFVFDLTVVEAGGSDKYVLTPVIGQSGTTVPIRATDTGGRPANAGPPPKNGSAPGNSDQAGGRPGSTGQAGAALEADVLGKVRANESATLRVTAGSDAIAGATVSVAGEVVGETNDRGRVTFVVPDVETVTIRVESGDQILERTLEVESGGGGGTGPENRSGNGDRGEPDGNGNASGGNNGNPTEG